MRFLGKSLQILLSTLFAFLTLATLGLFGVYWYYSPKLPSDEEVRKIEVQVPLRIYTQDNQLLAEYGEKRTRPVKLDQVPKQLKNAFLDIEDARFYEHQGIDLKGVARALYSVVSTGSASQGASTITMQLARNTFLNAGKTVDRKLQETLLAIKIEQNLSKDEILELYLNKIYLGNRAYGVATASEIYYGKPLDQLTLAQCAMIAGLPKAPSRYNPIVNPQRAMIRRNYILKRMLELQHISQTEYQTALSEPNTAQVHKTEFQIDAPYLTEMVRSEIVKRFKDNAYTQGYNVYTTIDPKEQKAAEESLRRALMVYDQRHGYHGSEDNINLKEFKTDDDLLDKLSTYPAIPDLPVAAVLNVDSKSADILVSNEKRLSLDLEAVRWARKFHSSDRRGSAPSHVNDVLKKGDIIRVRQTDPAKEQWVLSQIPEVGGALVSMDPNTGAVRAVMGGFDFDYSKFNRATQAVRQPGSSFKPIVYAAALTKGYTPNSIVNDAPISIPGSNWKPENFGGNYVGPTTLAEALAKSRNLVSIRLMKSVGVKYTVDFATRFGFSRDNLPQNLTLALGTNMTTPLQMATAYSAFANGGYKINAHFITRIEDSQGNPVAYDKPLMVCGDDKEICTVPVTPQTKESEEADKEKEKEKAADNTKTNEKPNTEQDKPSWDNNDPNKKPDDKNQPTTAVETIDYPAAKRILDKRTHYQIVNMLQGVTQFGTAARAGRSLNRKDIAGKTGTTNDQKDAWFCGFTPKVVTVVWVGYDDMSKLGEGETGTNVALPMWIDYMHRILEGSPVKEWSKPADVKDSELVKMPEDNAGNNTKNDAPSSTPRQNQSTAPRAPANGFEYKREQDLHPQRQQPQAAQSNTRQNGNQQQRRAPAAPAPAPKRAPERVEIPEQIF